MFKRPVYVIVVTAVVVGATVTACGSSSDSSTVLNGRHTLTYSVAGLAIDAPVSVTFGDPAAHTFSSQTITTVPWTKEYTEDNQDAAYGRLTVDNKDNDTSLKCVVSGDGQTLVQKDVPAGQSVDCAILHF